MKEAEKKKMSLKTKIFASISIIATLGAIVLLVIILTTSNNKTSSPGNDNQNNNLENWDNLSDYEQIESYFTTVKGYWISGNLFFTFINKDDQHFIEYGLYGASYGETGEIKDAKITGTNAFCLTVFIPATPANEMDNARPERTETICIDVSNLENENRLNVKFDNNSIGGKEWHTYEYGGTSIEEAYKDGMVAEY